MTTRFLAAVFALDVPLLPSDDTTQPVWLAKQATVVEPFAFELIDLVETIDSTCDTIGVTLPRTGAESPRTARHTTPGRGCPRRRSPPRQPGGRLSPGSACRRRRHLPAPRPDRPAPAGTA